MQAIRFQCMRVFASFMLIFCLLLHSGNSHARAVNIGLVMDGTSSVSKENIAALKHEINQLLDGEYQVTYYEGSDFSGRWSLERVESIFKATQHNAELDVVIAYGALASHVAIQARQLNKPTIATLFLDSDLQSVPREGDRSGRHNLTYIQHQRSFLNDVTLYREITPFKKLAVLGDESLTHIPTFNELLGKATHRLNQEGIALEFIPVSSDIDRLIRTINQKIKPGDAIYLLPNDRLTNPQIQMLGEAMIKEKIAAFAMGESRVVRQGFLAVYSHEMAHKREFRRIALNIREILHGEAAASLNVFQETDNQLLINQSTASRLGIGLSWSLLERATVVNEQSSDSETLWTLSSVTNEALRQNLAYLADEQALSAIRENIKNARAKRMPSLSLDIQSTWIDEDRSRFSNGNSAEQDLSASITLQQLIYNESAWSNVAVQEMLYQAEAYDLASNALDIQSRAALDYINLLRARSLVNIENKNLTLTKANLTRAERRVNAGAARKSEIFRWQSQLSDNQRSLLNARSREQNARLQLNQQLNRPLNEKIQTEIFDKNHPVFDFNRKVVTRYVTGPASLQRFAESSARFGEARSPEILGLQENIRAQERLLKASKRQYYVPEISLQASLKEHIDKGGEGDNYPPGVNINDTDASVAIVMSLPLYEGGSRSAATSKQIFIIKQLQLQLANSRNQIKQQIYSAINDLSSSYPGMQHAEDALQAARQNYEIVRKSYERGTVSIVDFLDAQNQVFGAEISAINAVYDYLEDQISYQRAIAYFFDLSDETAIDIIFSEKG